MKKAVIKALRKKYGEEGMGRRVSLMGGPAKTQELFEEYKALGLPAFLGVVGQKTDPQISGKVVEPKQASGPFGFGKYGGRGLSPSKAAAYSSYNQLQTKQGNSPWFYSFRPSNAQALPASLRDPIFGKFIDDYSNSDFEEKDCQAAMELCDALSAFYDHENVYRDEINRLLTKHLGITVEPTEFIAGSPCDGAWTTEVDSIKLALVIHGCKLTFTSTRADSACEGLAYLEDSIRPLWNRLQGFHFPCLLIEVVANALRVSAVFVGGAELDHKLCCEPLTEFVVGGNFLRAQPNRMTRMAKLVCALRKAAGNLKEYYSAIQGYKGTPATESLPSFVRERYESATWLEQDKLANERRLIFLCNQDKKRTLLKFVHGHYSVDIHHKLAADGLAPQLLLHELIPGGWNVIEMEYLSKIDGWETLLEHPDSSSERLQQAVEATVNRFHSDEKMFVHSDLKPANILVRRLKEEYQVVLIDLDNVGIENKDRYLGFQSREYPWPANHAAGKLMRRADDKAFLISTWDTSRKPRQPKAQMRCCQAFARGPQKCLLSRGRVGAVSYWLTDLRH